MIVAYRVNAATAFIVRRLISVKHASLVNLLPGREVVPEFLQENFTAEKLAAAIDQLLRSSEAREAQRAGFREVAGLLGGHYPPPSVRAARLVLDIARRRREQAEPAAAETHR
jgi:lipid-A-disaccharide synthase